MVRKTRGTAYALPLSWRRRQVCHADQVLDPIQEASPLSHPSIHRWHWWTTWEARRSLSFYTANMSISCTTVLGKWEIRRTRWQSKNMHESIASIPVRLANPVQLFSSLISLFERCHCRKRNCSSCYLAGNIFYSFCCGMESNWLIFLSLHLGRNHNGSCALRKVPELVLCNSIFRLLSQYWLLSD
jgi:hypothetical protein